MSEYIDKDALMETLKNAHKRLIETIGYTQHTIGFEGAMDYVEEAPPADVVEVRHGKWIKATDDWEGSFYAECDQCHKVTPNGWNMNYCPNCGARMDGESE